MKDEGKCGETAHFLQIELIFAALRTIYVVSLYDDTSITKIES